MPALTKPPAPADPLNPTLDESSALVAVLAEDFRANEKSYLSPEYQEAEVRKDFIDKLLIALGWDVNHDVQKNPFQQEVKVERTVTVATAQKRADYALALAPNFDVPVLYVEAKKPAGDIATADNYFQAIRYAYQKSHPIAVLTDFEQLHILDARFKPSINTALARALRKYHYSDYTNPERFAEIYYLIARPPVAAGSLKAFAEKLPRPKGRPGQKSFLPASPKPVNDALLEELDELRKTLARALKNRNPSLDSSQLTELTQRILDRLVFIRFLEDKLIEPDHLIAAFGQSAASSAWQDFLAASRRLDKTYNGIVFKHHNLLDDPAALAIDDKPLAEVLDAFDHTKSPYLFNQIPIHILGSIYERFLGNVITATAKRADLEPKPEVREARGVYYTPQYIVDYIVDNTVATLIDGKSPADISFLRFADIACGSGSFLLGVYDTLLKYHAAWYNHPAHKAPPSAVIKRAGVLHLTLEEKSRILTNNIYGVDIDPQAVEVAQLSLYLKLLEEETTASARQFTMDFKKPLLPSLAHNIKCGNSLINTDFRPSQHRLFDADNLIARANPFNWQREFPFLASGPAGFDVVLGNPPYVLITQEAFPNGIRDYLLRSPTAQYKSDLFHLFIQRGTDLLRPDGQLAYILPSPWLTMKFTDRLRSYVLQNASIREMVLFDHRVFRDADVHTLLLFLSKGRPSPKHKTTVRHVPFAASTLDIRSAPTASLPQNAWLAAPGHAIETRATGPAGALARRLRAACPPLRQLARASLGCQAYNSLKHSPEQIRARVFHAATRRTKEYLPELAGKDVDRYCIDRQRGQWIRYGPWLHDYRPLDWLQGPRILVREIPGPPPYRIRAAYVEHTYCNYKTILNVNPDQHTPFSMKFLTAVLNSRLLSFLYPLVSNKPLAQSFPRLSVGDLRNLPLPPINLTLASDKSLHDQIVALVDSMLTLPPKVRAAKTDHDRTLLTRQVAATDAQIDALVYRLYNLTPDEIKLVEAAASAS